MLDIETSKQTDTGYTLLSIKNYDRYQGSSSASVDIQNGSGLDIESDTESPSHPHPIPTPKKVKKKKKERRTGVLPLAFKNLLSRFTPNDQDCIRQAITAIGTTRASGQLTPVAIDRLACERSGFSPDDVLQACRAYLNQDCAAKRKSEKYFLGIVKRISSTHKGNQNTPTFQPLPKSEVSLAIERAQANLGQEQQK